MSRIQGKPGKSSVLKFVFYYRSEGGKYANLQDPVRVRGAAMPQSSPDGGKEDNGLMLLIVPCSSLMSRYSQVDPSTETKSVGYDVRNRA